MAVAHEINKIMKKILRRPRILNCKEDYSVSTKITILLRKLIYFDLYKYLFLIFLKD